MTKPSDKPRRIEIFKAGTHVTLKGRPLDFSEADLKATASAYSPAKSEAPVVVGHPKLDAPAYGWVSALAFQEGGLVADLVQVDPAFAEMVAAGRFKKVSASFYPPGHKDNPAPETFYLRHVGFLGAAPPSVKGLKPIEFGEGEEGVVFAEFSERERWGWRSVADLLRRLREKFIEKDGVEAADQTLPSYLIDDVARAGEEEVNAANIAPEFAEGVTKEDDMSGTERDAAFAEREAGLSAREQKLAEQERAAAAHEAAEFAEKLSRKGRVLPREKDGIAALLTALPADSRIEFGEGEGKFSGGAGEFLRGFLAGLPVRVDFAERTGDGAGNDEPVEFSAADGYSVAPDRLEAHRRILRYAKDNNTDYATAALAVGDK